MIEPTEPTEPSPRGGIPDGDRPRGGLGHRQRVGIVIVVVIVAVAGLITGAGVSPGEIGDAVEQRLLGDPEPDLDRARLVASDSTEGVGVTVSLAPTDRGSGECIVIATDWQGTTQDGSSGVTSRRVQCWFDGPAVGWSDPTFRLVRPSDRFGVLTEAPIGPPGDPDAAVALIGAVFSDVATVTVELGDGAQYSFNVITDDGWFAAILPDGLADIDRLDGTLVNKVASLKLIDVEGRVLATIAPDSLDPVNYG